MAASLPFLALAMTLGSFWWIWLRRGRLKASAPLVFASAVSSHQALMRFPLVLYNTGASPIVVDNLRLRLDDRKWAWRTIRSTLRPRPNDIADFAKPFAVAGRSTYELVVEFGGDDTGWVPENGSDYPAVIEYLNRDEWKMLAEFIWWAPTHDTGAYIAHRNQKNCNGPVEDA